MKKLLTLLSATLVAVASLATVASADAISPSFSIEISDVSEGYAIADILVEADTELALAKSGPRYTGFAVTEMQGNFNFDSDLFVLEPIEEAIPESGKATVSYNSVTGNFVAANTWGGNINNVISTTDKKVSVGCVWLLLKDANMTADELNKLDFADVSFAKIIVGEWQNQTGTGVKLFTTYATDGSGTEDCGVRVGTPAPAVVPEVDVTGAFQTTDANWIAENGKTIYWGVEFKNGGFNGTAIAKIFNETGTERELEIKAAPEAEVNGNATFGVFAILGDKTDALKLTVTSGTVTDTADAFVAAE